MRNLNPSRGFGTDFGSRLGMSDLARRATRPRAARRGTVQSSSRRFRSTSPTVGQDAITWKCLKGCPMEIHRWYMGCLGSGSFFLAWMLEPGMEQGAYRPGQVTLRSCPLLQVSTSIDPRGRADWVRPTVRPTNRGNVHPLVLFLQTLTCMARVQRLQSYLLRPAGHG